jgi:hypothetical protein
MPNAGGSRQATRPSEKAATCPGGDSRLIHGTGSLEVLISGAGVRRPGTSGGEPAPSALTHIALADRALWHGGVFIRGSRLPRTLQASGTVSIARTRGQLSIPSMRERPSDETALALAEFLGRHWRLSTAVMRATSSIPPRSPPNSPRFSRAANRRYAGLAEPEGGITWQNEHRRPRSH